MDSIGRAGMQLFVDAGQAVDSDLVNGLIREVLVEKVVTLLGQRPSDEEQAAEQRAVPKLSAGVDEDKMGTTEPSPRVCLQNEIWNIRMKYVVNLNFLNHCVKIGRLYK